MTNISRILSVILAILMLQAAVAPRVFADDWSTPGRMRLSAQPVAPDAARQVLAGRNIPPLTGVSFPVPADIRELARGLKNDPDLIYRYVHDRIEYELGYGARKGALGALIDQRGNAFDQAALLVELFRAAGLDAGYVHGTIHLTGTQISAWLGSANNADAISSLLGSAGIPATVSPASGNVSVDYVDMDHVWVRVSSGGGVLVFDPSYKTYTVKPPINLAQAMGYSRSGLISAAGGQIHIAPPGSTTDYSYVDNLSRGGVRNALSGYTSTLANYIRAGLPDAVISDIVGGRTINPAPEQLRQASLPYQGSFTENWNEVPDQYRALIRIACGGVDVWLRSADLYGRRFTLFPAGDSIALRLDGVQIASGTVGSTLTLEVDHPYAAAASENDDPGTYGDQIGRVYQVGGASMFILVGLGDMGKQMPGRHQKILKEFKLAGAVEGSEPVLGETLAVTAFGFASQSSYANRLAAQVAGVRIVNHHNIGAIVQKPGSMVMDLGLCRSSAMALDGNAVRSIAGFLSYADRSSILESGVMDQIHGFGGVSAASVMDLAALQNQRIIKVAPENWAHINLELDLSANAPKLVALVESIINSDSEYHLVIPSADAMSDAAWTGHGLIAFGVDENGASNPGHVLHLLAGRKGSACTNADDSDCQAKSKKAGSLKTGYDDCTKKRNEVRKPIDMATGRFYHYFSDITTGSGPGELTFRRSYYSSNRLEDNGLGYGWGHDFSAGVQVVSDGFTALGENDPATAAAAIVALYAVHDLLTDSVAMDRVVLTSIIDAWLMDQLTNNTVHISFPGGSKQFYRNPDGTYGGSPCCTDETLTRGAGGEYIVTTLNGETIQFSPEGRLQNKADSNGNTVSYAYGDDGNLVGVSNSFGRSITLDWTDGRISQVSAGSRTVDFTYDENGRLVSSTNAAGNTTTFEYDDKNRMTAMRSPLDPDVPFVANTYDDIDLIKTQFIAGKTAIHYFFGGFRSEEIGPLGNSRLWFFDRNQSTIRMVDQAGRAIAMEYDGRKRLTRKTLPEGNAIEYTYDSNNKPLTVTRVPKDGGQGLTTTFTYEANFHKIETVTDPLGRITTFGYDTGGNLTSVMQPLAGGANPTTTFTYNSQGLPLTQTDPSGMVTQYGYNAAGDVTSITVDPGGKNLTTSLGYNAHGDLTSVTDPRGNTTSFAYDDMRRMTQSTAPSPFNYTTAFGYDADGNLASVSRQGPPVQTASATWSITGKKLTETSPQGFITQYLYDDLDRLWKIIDPENRTTQYAYDAVGRMVQAVNGNGHSEASYTYTDNGLVQTVRDAKNNQTTYTYDDYDRLIRTTFPNGSFEHLTLDAAGRATAVRMRDGRTVGYTLDALDRTTNRTIPGSSPDSYTYDPDGKVIDAIKAGFGILHHAYDSAGRLTTVTWPNGRTMGYQYDADSNVTRMTYPDGSYVVYEYDELGRMTGVKYDPNADDVAPTPSTIATYTYDALSRRSSLTYANNASTSYSYSLNDNLTNLTFQADGSSSTLTYGYDMTGFRTGMTVDDLRFEPQFLLSGQKGLNANSLNQYTSMTGKVLTYDGNGNLSYDGTFTYVHDALNRLASAAKQGDANTYQYGPMGRRTSKADASGAATNYLYSGDHAAVEYDDSGTLVRKFIYGPGIDEPLVMITPGQNPTAETRYYYHADVLGSVVGLTNSTGAWAETYSYSAWGELNGSSSVGNPYFYTGRRYDNETGLYYYRARYYDAYLRRFIQPDPIGFDGGMNWYAYVGNSPVNYVDPYGEAGPIISAIIEVAFFIHDTYDLYQTLTDSCATQFDKQIATTLYVVGAAAPFGAYNKGYQTGKKFLGEARKKVVKFKRWKRGDAIDKPLPDGSNPSWRVVRSRYWKNRYEASKNTGEFSKANLRRMRRGDAPQDYNPKTGYWESREVHHHTPQRINGSNNPINLREVTPDQHRSLDQYRR